MVIHSYRVRYGYVPGDPALAAIEEQLAVQPKISVPTIVLQGEAPGTVPPEASIAHAKQFTGPYQRRTIPRVGHNVPQEAPTGDGGCRPGTRPDELAGGVAPRHFTNRATTLTFPVVVNQLKGGDPVSHAKEHVRTLVNILERCESLI